MDPSVYIAVAAMGGLGLVFASFLAIADKKFRVEEDPLVEKIIDALPGTNCGACGFAGCNQLAEKMAQKLAGVDACPAGGQEVADIVASALGIESVVTVRQFAVVLCRGGDEEARRTATYRGESTCTAATLTGSEKVCQYGCLGLGECVDACNFGAMAMSDNGLPVVFYDKCVGCGACARACPKDIIEMHPEDRTLFVYCRNKDKGPVAKKACTVACIGCTLCVKGCEVEGGIEMKNNLAMINYELCPQDDVPTRKCPTKCIIDGEEPGITKDSFYASKMKDAG